MTRVLTDPLQNYEAIGRALSSAAHPGWDRIEVNVQLDGLRVDVVAACWKGAATEPVGYLTGVPRLAAYFYDLDQLISTEAKGHIKKFLFVLFANGKFDVNFEY